MIRRAPRNPGVFNDHLGNVREAGDKRETQTDRLFSFSFFFFFFFFPHFFRIRERDDGKVAKRITYE